MDSSLTETQMLHKAATLSEALPFMREFSGETFVIKYGGHAMGNEELAKQFAQDIVLLKHVGINPIVVHGGGPQIGLMLECLKIKSDFIDGLRVTDKTTVEIVEMVLCGSINKQIVHEINQAGGNAIGISGKDGNLIRANKVKRTRKDPDSNIEKILDLGFVGEPSYVDPLILEEFNQSDMIPVIAPIGVGDNGETYNINADTAAGAVASAMMARKMIMLTDVKGVLNDGEIVSEMGINDGRDFIKKGIVTGGMIPKLQTCIDALENGVEATHILDGRIPHVLLIEIFTEHGAGTMLKIA